MLIKRIHDRPHHCQIIKSPMNLVFLLFFLVNGIIIGQVSGNSTYDLGVEAFLNNKPGEAMVHFESLVGQGNTDPVVFLYLGMVYEQLGFYDMAVTTFTQAAQSSQEHRTQAFFNIGNVQVRLGNQEKALEFYSQAIESRRNFAPAYLNRGNLYLRDYQLESAVTDYRLFLQFAPNDPVSPKVREMIAAIEGEFVARQAEEASRLAQERQQALQAQARAEQAERDAQAQAQEAQRIAREEDDRRRALLDSVFSSLGTASSSGTGLGGGAESVIEVDEEITIDGF